MSQEVKDFQRATADRILHIYKNLGHRRVLLADEVGLGKTFVAKQVINLVREWHKQEKDDFFKVVYICSNANIADQNIEKLGVENRMSISESRLSMQHLYIKLAEKRIAEQHEQGEMPESIIPLTPSTSFRFYSAQGTANERALMYNILCGLDQFKDYKEVISDFLSCNVKNWQELTNIYNEKIKGCGDDYLCEMYSKLQTRLSDTIINQLIEYAQNVCNNRQRADIINKLRRIFAESVLTCSILTWLSWMSFNASIRCSNKAMTSNPCWPTNSLTTSVPIRRYCCFPLRPTNLIPPLKS